jgi:hypothetical protein
MLLLLLLRQLRPLLLRQRLRLHNSWQAPAKPIESCLLLSRGSVLNVISLSVLHIIAQPTAAVGTCCYRTLSARGACESALSAAQEVLTGLAARNWPAAAMSEPRAA